MIKKLAPLEEPAFLYSIQILGCLFPKFSLQDIFQGRLTDLL
jgi:hypothetical protein